MRDFKKTGPLKTAGIYTYTLAHTHTLTEAPIHSNITIIFITISFYVCPVVYIINVGDYIYVILGPYKYKLLFFIVAQPNCSVVNVLL